MKITRRTALKGLGAAFLAVNLWLMPCSEPEDIAVASYVLRDQYLQIQFIKTLRGSMVIAPFGMDPQLAVNGPFATVNWNRLVA